VALDDFGAGFGSFQYLKHLPFSYLKIDGEFIRGLLGSRTDQLVVRALVDVVRGMGRETIAEFVGDARTLGMLRSYGVDYAQGFEVGRPQPDLPALA
jgi:EAL domain-containing protein (putative c-di-GMP-specific phosphodiesterase class I)